MWWVAIDRLWLFFIISQNVWYLYPVHSCFTIVELLYYILFHILYYILFYSILLVRATLFFVWWVVLRTIIMGISENMHLIRGHSEVMLSYIDCWAHNNRTATVRKRLPFSKLSVVHSFKAAIKTYQLAWHRSSITNRLLQKTSLAMVCIRQATVHDLLQMQCTNLSCLPEIIRLVSGYSIG